MSKINKCLIINCNKRKEFFNKKYDIFCNEHNIKFTDFIGNQWIPNATIEKWRKYPKLHTEFVNLKAAEFIHQENKKINPKVSFSQTGKEILKRENLNAK
ncbi:MULTISPECIES: hypothetical protein [unclassified Spiroplasma]|uniref:hypothetical protein n=1 Tax=unclassified Spiroplasma TaxID=2637901 RepID=UPI0030CAD3F2